MPGLSYFIRNLYQSKLLIVDGLVYILSLANKATIDASAIDQLSQLGWDRIVTLSCINLQLYSDKCLSLIKETWYPVAHVHMDLHKQICWHGSE